MTLSYSMPVVEDSRGVRLSSGGNVPSVQHSLIPPLAELAQKRLLFFAGKGGVGKTTVAATVAFTLAQAGKKTLFIELDASAHATRLFGTSPTGQHPTDPQPVSPSLFILSTSGQRALEEYLQLIIPFKPLLRAIVESRAYQYFVAAAPGLKELLTIGKVWYEERKREGEQPRWDNIVIDLPATGHSLQYLRMPRAAHETFGGIISRESERIAAVLHDPDKTAVNLVTTADELPVSETQDAYQQLTTELHLPMGALFINRTRTAPLSASALKALTIHNTASAAERAVINTVLRCGQQEAEETESQTTRLQPLQHLPLPVITLPFVVADMADERLVEHLSHALITPAQESASRGRASQRKRIRTPRTSHAE